MKELKISKDSYIGCVNTLMRFDEFTNNAYNLGIDFLEADALIDMECALTSLLEDLTNDNDPYGSMLTYFLYDLNHGTEWKPGMITDKDGNDIPLKTTEDLWAYLEKENK